MDRLNTTDFDFSEEEILNELNRLGYDNVPTSRLREFQRDLKLLMLQDKSTNTSLSSQYQDDTTTDIDTTPGPSMKITISKDSQLINDESIDNKPQQINIVKRAPVKYKSDVPSVSSYQRGQYSLYDQSDLPDDVSEADSDIRRTVKRKTVRKSEKGGIFVDESITESDTGSIIDAHERLQRLALRDFDDMQIDRRPRSWRNEDEPPYRLAPDDHRPASVILRRSEHPHTKNLRKSDPVARYQQFKQQWQSYRAPGEKNHKNLRWNVRGRMLQQEVPDKKTHRVFVENKYVIPSEKQRKNLRWQVRMDMAQGVKPASGFYHD